MKSNVHILLFLNTFTNPLMKIFQFNESDVRIPSGRRGKI